MVYLKIECSNLLEGAIVQKILEIEGFEGGGSPKDKNPVYWADSNRIDRFHRNSHINKISFKDFLKNKDFQIDSSNLW